jgi:glycolate oxidase FAD binding subunit
MDLSPDAFAAAVVAAPGPVTVTGLGTRGGPVAGVRTVRAPSGIGTFLAEEMTVECGAGTPVDELAAALAARGQFVALPEGGTVGGALAVGRSGLLRLGHGPVRDTLLQCRVVLADGTVVKAGGSTVKNVSGFDLCRLLVGSHGTLAFFATVILRTRPLPACRAWYATTAPPGPLRASLHRPSALLHDGTTTWVCLEGHPDDVADEAARAGLGEPVSGPPPVPAGGRRLLAAAERPGAARPTIDGAHLAEIGVGVVHTAQAPSDDPPPDPAVVALCARAKRLFDAHGRLNPGRAPFGVDAPVATGGAG